MYTLIYSHKYIYIFVHKYICICIYTHIWSTVPSTAEGSSWQWSTSCSRSWLPLLRPVCHMLQQTATHNATHCKTRQNDQTSLFDMASTLASFVETGLSHSYLPWLLHVCYDSFMCTMAHLCVLWLVQVCHDSSMYIITHLCVSWKMCVRTHSCVPWLMHKCAETHSCVARLMHTCDMTHPCIPWCIHACHDWFISATWAITHIREWMSLLWMSQLNHTITHLTRVKSSAALILCCA